MSCRIAFLFLLAVTVCSASAAADDVTIVAPTTEAGEGLDLYAVADLFQESESLEGFERALNDPDSGINNLDLDGNGEVDYIRVVEQADGDVHVVILQVELAENEFQDVASIEIEGTGNEDEVNVQVTGNEEVYGPNYYLVPATAVAITAWRILTPMYRPGYRVWVSPWRYRGHPAWWVPWRAVPRATYSTRIVRYHNRTVFRYTTTRKVVRSRSVYTVKRSTKVASKKTVKTTQKTYTRKQSTTVATTQGKQARKKQTTQSKSQTTKKTQTTKTQTTKKQTKKKPKPPGAG